MEILEAIKPEVIWSSISSFVLSNPQNIVSHIGKKKPWKYEREKSSRDKFCNLLFRMLIFSILYALASIFLIVLTEKVWYNENWKRGICIGLCMLFGVVICTNEKKEHKISIKEKYTCRCKNVLEIMSVVIPVFLPIMLAIVYISEPKSVVYIAARICTCVMLALFLLWGIVFIDNNREVKYKCVKIYLEDNVILDNIDVTTMYLKGGWVIATKMDNQSEVRFKNQDIKRVEYTPI